MRGHVNLPTPNAPEITLEVAGLGSRSYAFVIDWHIRLVVALAWVALLWLLNAWLDPLFWVGEGRLTAGIYIMFVPALALYFLYHPILEIIMQGRTPGKRMAGVRIVTSHGQTPGVGPLLLRNVFRLVDSAPAFYIIGFIVVLSTRDQVRIGDLAAGTLLVHEERLSQEHLERSTHLILKGTLTLQDQELLLDILDRWKGLSRPARIALGQKFLARIGEDAPADLPPRQLERALLDQFRKLAGG